MTIQADLCRTWLETPKTDFLASQLIFNATSYDLLDSVCLKPANAALRPKFYTDSFIVAS